MFNKDWCFMNSRDFNIFFLCTLLLLYPYWGILKSLRDTDEWPDWSACLSMYNLLSLPACSIILSFSLVAVSSKYVSKHVISGYYVRSCSSSSFVWYFVSNPEPSFLLICMCYVVGFWGSNFLSLFTLIGNN